MPEDSEEGVLASAAVGCPEEDQYRTPCQGLMTANNNNNNNNNRAMRTRVDGVHPGNFLTCREDLVVA